MMIDIIAIFALAGATVVNANLEREESYLQERVKLELWSRGEYSFDAYSEHELNMLEPSAVWSSMRLGPVRKARRDFLLQDDCIELDCHFTRGLLTKLRGGATTDQGAVLKSPGLLENRLNELAVEFGQDFRDAIKKNEEEHKHDCEVSCESFYCAPEPALSGEWNTSNPLNGTSFKSYSFGATPPEDFSEEFGFPLDLMKVTQNEPLFSAEEAAKVIQIAQEEGIENNEYQSGKYKLGGDWLTNLPNTRKWFNEKLESTMFPLLSHLFPEIVSSPSVLRAHSVSLLKYNASHPRTDVHIDNGILAMTLAMTPKNEYVGGGTFFEHMGVGSILPMDVGHGTFRPGSVRHGGHKVTKGTRYILGAFLLIEDRVEHVRRLKNRGSELRRIPDLEGAAKHFQWALAINPKCTTCKCCCCVFLYYDIGDGL
jgi:hypothetical protein